MLPGYIALFAFKPNASQYLLTIFTGVDFRVPQPILTTVTIDGDSFNVLSAQVSMNTPHDHLGIPIMGSMLCSIDVVVNIHDTVNMPFTTLQKLFQLARLVTRDKVKDIKVDFWQDERREDVICSYTFRGWIANWRTMSGHGENHLQEISIQPTLDEKNFTDLAIGN